MYENKTFYTNKKSANILLIGGSVFAVICYATTMGWVAYIQPFTTPFEFQIIAAIICTGLWISVLLAYKKKAKSREAVVISDEGVTDSIYELSYGLIKWNDIQGATEKDGMVLIMVDNHNEFISRAKNPGMKRLLGSYIKKYNTPVVLNASYLTSTAQELATAIQSNIK